LKADNEKEGLVFGRREKVSTTTKMQAGALVQTGCDVVNFCLTTSLNECFCEYQTPSNCTDKWRITQLGMSLDCCFHIIL